MEDDNPDTLAPITILIFLNHIKNYPSIRNGAQMFHCGEDYYQDSINRVKRNLNRSEEWAELISWDARSSDGTIRFNNGIFVQTIIDGFPCYVQKTENCFSGKEGTYVYRYLIVTSLLGRIVYWYGPYEGKSNDITLLDESNFLKENISNSLKYVLGDEIFASRSNMLFVKHNSSFDSEEVQDRNSQLSAWRSKVENVIAQVKNLMFAKDTYRGHSMEEHGLFMNIIFGLVNLNFFYRVDR